ncbi:MAG: phosphoribosylglycinamide formyltransferase [Lagierella massiliensis]|nr:phosphoribosylglycinamide formyltransferase [Lagierella massiliensis]
MSLGIKNIAIFASGSGSNAQAIIEACESGEINGVVRVVISNNPNAYVLERAKKHNIEILVETDYDKISQKLKELKIDLIVLAGYLKILPSSFIKDFENKIINIHPSLIPSFCGNAFYGEHVHKAAIERGVKYSGATTHFVNEIADAGPIIFQKVVEVKEGDDYKTLAKRILKEEHPLLVQSVKYFCEDKLEVKGHIVYTKE